MACTCMPHIIMHDGEIRRGDEEAEKIDDDEEEEEKGRGEGCAWCVLFFSHPSSHSNRRSTA